MTCFESVTQKLASERGLVIWFHPSREQAGMWGQRVGTMFQGDTDLGEPEALI